MFSAPDLAWSDDLGNLTGVHEDLMGFF